MGDHDRGLRGRRRPSLSAVAPPRPLLALVVLGATLLGVATAANCPPISLKTVEVECRWVMGRPVGCNSTCAPGTRAFFSCKPLFRLPQSIVARQTASRQPEDRANSLDPQALDDGGMEHAMCREDGQWAPLPFTCVPECGRIIGNGETLVVDGQPVNSPVDFPWHVAIYDRKHRDGAAQVCGGSLVTTKFFVSAAHCFYNPQSKWSDVVMRPASDFSVAVGKLYRDWNTREEKSQIRDLLHIHINGYGGPRQYEARDLALVEMAVPVEVTAFSMPVCVDWGHQERDLRDGDVGTVLGWGNLPNRPIHTTLQSAGLPFVPRDKCLKAINTKLVPYVMSNDRFCAGFLNSTTVAHGDSGGGLSFMSDDGKWYLKGVVSVGMPGMRTFSAFTNVSNFVRWMADKIQDEEIRAAAAEHHTPLEIPIEYTASDLEDEQRVAYYREDVGLNLFHMHWHYFYFKYLPPKGMLQMDRRGELLFYMHEQIVVRYNLERLANRLPRTKRLVLREPIKEGYYPKLDTLVSSRVWPGRPPNVRLTDMNRDGLKIDLEDLERWTARLYEAIAVGALQNTTGGLIKLTEQGGAELLANTIESNTLTANRQLYGELTNMGHILISLAHDPENRYLESFGVMGDAAVSLRDPVFYRWHQYILDIMFEFKDTLPSYTPEQLNFRDVEIRDVNVFAEDSSKANLLSTYWQARDLVLSRGLDFAPRQPVYARLTHLQHKPFTYTIRVENKAARPKEGYVRIFIAPKFDEHGKPMLFRDMRHLMVELDKFPVALSPGVNIIKRHSSQSSLTIPFERTFRNLDANRPAAKSKGHRDEFTFCGCGFPQHMLLPRGNTEGLQYHLFVMVTDYTKDKVEQTLHGQCNQAHSVCGVYRGLYPDKRPMGFPFDRRPAGRIDSLRSFLTPNMFAQSVVIRFKDTVVQAARNASTFGTDNGIIKLPVPLGVSADREKGQSALNRQQEREREQQQQGYQLPEIIKA